MAQLRLRAVTGALPPTALAALPCSLSGQLAEGGPVTGRSRLGSLIGCLLAALLAALAVLPGSAHAGAFSDSYQAHDDTAWFSADTCRLSQPVTGAEPDAAGSFPVLVWVTGTGAEGEWVDGKLARPYDQALAKAVVAKAAEAGFVAVFPQYRGRWTVGSNSGTDLQARCMFDRPRAHRSLLDAVCARPKADCSRVVVAGHSQGGMIAMRAGNHAPVSAAWATGVFYAPNAPFWTSRERGGQRVLPDSRLRIATGKADMDAWWIFGFKAGDYSHLNTFTGLSCANGTVSCMRSDGSGWHVVQHQPAPDGPSDRYADHCFMSVNNRTCTEPQAVDPFWRDGHAAWTLPPTLDWLRRQAG